MAYLICPIQVSDLTLPQEKPSVKLSKELQYLKRAYKKAETYMNGVQVEESKTKYLRATFSKNGSFPPDIPTRIEILTPVMCG